MTLKYIIAWFLLIVGAVLTFGTKSIVQKKYADNEELMQKYLYIFKTIGMWLVIIGALVIFILGGSFGG
ncbi:MAG: hypothetical protein IKL09_00945 [Clostridia bacterium]|nr:hypothetical protein [Clostridia bacterium]MBR6646064.1 hypothetical protein [Clostridia bacterium]